MPEEKNVFEVWIMRAVAGLMVPVLLSVPKVYMAVTGYEELKKWQTEEIKKQGDQMVLQYRFDEMEKKLDKILTYVEEQP